MKMKLNRWFYAVVGVIVLLCGGLIYAWSVLSRPVAAYFTEWTSAQLSLTFTICMMFFCLGGLVAGVLSGKINVKINMIIAALLFLVGFWVASRTQSLGGLYLGYGVMAGTAAGFLYNTVMGTITKYFPDKQGLISGLLLMGFGLGSFIIGKVFQAYTGTGEAWRHSFRLFGIILFVIVILSSIFIRKPDTTEFVKYIPSTEGENKQKFSQMTVEMKATQMIRRSSFWFYFVWATLFSCAGLALISQASSVAVEVAPKATPGTISTVVGLISIFNGIGRVIFGGLFDKLGRAKTMLFNIVLFCVAVVFLILSLIAGNFVVLIIGFIITGLAYGGVTPTNSAFVSSFYGKENYPINFSIVNMNLLVASFGSTIAGMLYDVSGSYFSTLIFMFAAIVVGGISSMLIRKP